MTFPHPGRRHLAGRAAPGQCRSSRGPARIKARPDQPITSVEARHLSRSQGTIDANNGRRPAPNRVPTKTARSPCKFMALTPEARAGLGDRRCLEEFVHGLTTRRYKPGKEPPDMFDCFKRW